MLKKSIILYQLIVFCLVISSSFAQNYKHRLMIGSEVGGQFYRYRGDYPDYVSHYYRAVTITPKIGIFINNKILVGVQAGKSFFKSDVLSLPSHSRFGFLVRYYPVHKVKFLPYIEYNHFWTNYGPNPNDKKSFLNTGNEYKYQILSPLIGANVKVYKSLYIDLGWRIVTYYYNNQLKFNKIAPKLGIEYIFDKKKSKT